MVSSRISADKEYMQILFFLAWWSGAGLVGFIAFVLADLPPYITFRRGLVYDFFMDFRRLVESLSIKS